jgi:hypothetical protein
MHAKFWSKNLYGGNRSEDLGVDMRIVREDVDWIHLAQDRAQWRDVNTIVKLRVP